MAAVLLLLLLLHYLRADPPDTDPVVSGYDGSTKYTGDSVTLSCTVVGGNPAASLSLTCPDGTTSTSGTLTVTLSNTFHGRTCSCVGTHVVGGYSRTVATPTFIVNIPVTSVTIVPSTTVTVDVGTSTTLTCTTQPHSRPTASVTWYRVASGQPQKITTNIIVSHDTQNSAQTTTSVLSYVPSKEDNGRTVYCVSDGGWTGSTDTTLQSRLVSLNVRFAPRIHALTVTDPFPWLARDDYLGRLSCDTTAGNPSTTRYTWYRDGTPISSQTSQVISFNPPTSSDNGRLYKCRAENDFTDSRGSAPESNIETIHVEYPPTGKLTIAPSGTQSVTTGRQITLMCELKGGNPLATLTWQCKGSSMTGQNLTNTTTAVSRLTFAVDRTYHQQRCVCTARHQANPDRRFGTVRVRFYVFYPPEGTPTVTPSGTLSILTGTSVTLRCELGGGNPLAKLTWMCKGLPVTGQDLTNTTTALSSLTMRVNRAYQQQQCVCTTMYQFGQIGTVSVTFNILYAPTVRTFAVHYKSPFYKGDNVYLDCMIEGGNPLATLSWTCVDQSKESSINMNTTTRATSRLAIASITEVYNSRTCTCTASHVGLSTSLTKSVVITVYYPPSRPVLVVDTTHGGRLPWLDRPAFTGILTCTTTAGNPPTTQISWYNNDVIEPGQSARTRRFEPPDKDYNGHTFTCRAANSYTYTKKTDNVSNRLALSVEYDPIITLDESTAYINESQRFNRTCSAEGNPSPTVSWYRDSTLARSNGTLQFSGTDRQDAGTYRCTATARSTNDNLLLQSSKLLSLVVQYGPDIVIDITNTTENTTNFRLSCTANGVPDKYTFKWTHIFGSTVISDTFDQAIISGSVSTLTIPRVTYQDMGTYVCDVDNGYRGRDGEIVQTRHGVLSVQGSPQAISAQNRYVTEKETSHGISITYISFPEPVNTTIIRADSTVLPRRELSIIVSSVPVTVPFYNKEVSVDGYMVYLNFSDFRTRHQGHYQLYVRNAFDYFYNFEIIIADKPDPPSDLLIDQITQSSGVISWSPGDDNGNPQTFIVTYQNNKGGPPINTTLSYNITSYIANNLDVSTKYDVTVCASNAKGTSDTITTSFITKQGETSFSSSKGPNSPSMALVVVGAILIFISFCVLGFSIFLYRKSRLPSRPVDQQEETPKSVVFSSVLSSEKESDQMPTEENKSHYQELDPSDIQPPSTYECLSRDDDAAIMKYERDNYESLQGDSVKLDYEQLHVDDESKHYLNT